MKAGPVGSSNKDRNKMNPKSAAAGIPSIPQTTVSKQREETFKSMFESIKIEDAVDINIDITQLEQESDRLVESIARSDRLAGSIV